MEAVKNNTIPRCIYLEELEMVKADKTPSNDRRHLVCFWMPSFW